MRKKFLILVLAVAMVIPIFAQRVVESSEEFVSYDRNSISVITTRYNDKYDDVVFNTVGFFDFGSKFDINKINTKTVQVSQSRFLPEGTVSGWNYTTDDATADEVLTRLNQANVGKEILAYILGRDEQGHFKRDIINQRGEWNATDKDYIESQATQVDAMGQNGEKLIDNSFIIVFDMKNPERVETPAKDSKGKDITIVTWKADIGAMVFQIANAEQLIADVLTNMWIYENDEMSEQEAKKAAFDNLTVKMELVGSTGMHVSSKELSLCILSSKDRIMQKLENQVDAWQVTIDCETIEPFITAKIGKKEGVRNGNRFGIYGQVLNRETESLEFKRKGYVRATEVADNRRVADGTADSTYFYRISGLTALNGTEILKQRNDLGLGISFNYNNNGSAAAPSESHVFGSFAMFEIGIDYLAYINKRGFSHYIMLGIGMDKLTGDNLEKGQTEFGKFGIVTAVADEEHKFYFKNGASYFNGYLGYMFGIKLKQFAEIQPFIRGGVDIVTVSPDMDEQALKDLAEIEKYTITSEKDLKKSSSAWFVDPGIRLTVNVMYPVQVYLQANYSFGFGGGDKYNILNKYFEDCGYGHTYGLGIGGGVRVIL